MKKTFIIFMVAYLLTISIYELNLHYENPVMVTNSYPNFKVISDFTLRGSDTNVVRMHIINVKQPEDILIARARRAVLERKVGVIYYDGNYNRSLLIKSENELKKAGFKIGIPHPFKIPPYLNTLSAIFLIVFLGMFVDKRLYALLILALCDVWFNLSVYLTYFIVFLIPAIYLPKNVKNYFKNFLTIVLLGIGIHFLFFQTKYVVGISYPRGVKLILILPFVFMLYKYKIRFEKKDIRLIILLVILGIVYIIKSGNYIEPSIFERRVRDYMDIVFYVRPRFKEFLIGFPFMWIVSKYKVKNKFIMLLSILAYISIFDSFLHPYTDAILSIYRSFISLGLGIVIGEAYYRIYKTIKGRFKYEKA